MMRTSTAQETSSTMMMRLKCTIFFGVLALCGNAAAQLPAEAVDLAKVKIPEKQKPEDLCPVHLVPAAPDGPTWTYEGVTYRGSTPDAEAEFRKDPQRYVKAHAEKRWENNYIAAMSRVWCPVTDQLNPGGMHEWHQLGIDWESCCAFCNETVRDEDFPPALERLKERARISYELTGGKYVEGAKSPVEGALRTPAEIAALGRAAAAKPAADASCYDTPEWFTPDLAPTYVGGVHRIFEQRCLRCHRRGGLSPIDFTSYNGIRNWTKNLKASILSGAMPPWPADPAVGCFSNSAALSQQEKDLLVQWADAQFPRGEGPNPPLPAFGTWNIGEPDAVLHLPEYVIPAAVTAEFKEFELETDFPEDRWIIASEIRPEDPLLVTEVHAGVLGYLLPGNPAVVHAKGQARLLKAGQRVTVRVRYAKEAGWEAQDNTQIALKFAAPADVVQPLGMLVLRQNELAIPPGVNDFEAQAELRLDTDTALVEITPNLRERGKRLALEAKRPDGTITPLLSIPNWRHRWRLTYQLREPLALPKGTTLILRAVYDNSPANPDNPNPDAALAADAAGEALELRLATIDR